MTHIAIRLSTLLFALLLCARVAAAEEIRTDSFVLTVPPGWQQVRTEDELYNLTLYEPGDALVLLLIIGPARVPVERFVERYRAKFERGGFTCSPITTRDGTCLMEFSSRERKAYGSSYAASNGSQTSIFMLLAHEKAGIARLREVLRDNFTALDPGLFPRTF